VATASFADVRVADLGCRGDWAHYCASVRDGIRFALERGKKVLVVTQPYISERHREQQAELRNMLAAQFGRERSVGYVNLGDAIDLHNQSLVYDGMHMTSAGNAEIARRLLGPVVALMPDAFSAPAPAEGQQTAR
jgi:hypothetical protein